MIESLLRRLHSLLAHKSIAKVHDALSRHRDDPDDPAPGDQLRGLWAANLGQFATAVAEERRRRSGPRPLRGGARRVEVPVDRRRTWKNHFGNLVVQPLELAQARSLDDVKALVARAKEEGLRLRVAGGGYSFSDLVSTTGVLVELAGLRDFALLAPEQLRRPGPAKASYVRVGAGLTIAEINDRLAEHGLALENMPAFDGQAIVGAICTGVHGSGIKLGPLADQVESIELVAGDGAHYQIEPTDGFAAAPFVASAEPKDDAELFYSSVVGLGAMGIVTALTLRVRDQYSLTETRKKLRWSDVKPTMRANADEFAHYELLVNPYASADGHHYCVETCREELTAPPPPNVVPAIRHYLTGLLEGSGLAADLLVWFLGEIPELTPFALDRALDLLAFGDDGYTDVARKVLLLGPTNELQAISAESAVPIDLAEAAVEAVFELAADAAKIGRIYQTAPIGVRFVAGSRHYLAPQYGADPCCMIEMPLLEGTVGGYEILERFEARMRRDFKGRSHWGELHHEHDAGRRLSDEYPQLAAFRRARAKLDPDRIFSNALTERCDL